MRSGDAAGEDTGTVDAIALLAADDWETENRLLGSLQLSLGDFIGNHESPQLRHALLAVLEDVRDGLLSALLGLTVTGEADSSSERWSGWRGTRRQHGTFTWLDQILHAQRTRLADVES